MSLFPDVLFAAASSDEPHDQYEQLNPKFNVHRLSLMTMLAGS
jgi:hypothetical protein